MKKTIMFGLQVFAILILYMAIFVTYLERKDVQSSQSIERNETIGSSLGSTSSLVDMIGNTFTTSFSGVISCGK